MSIFLIIVAIVLFMCWCDGYASMRPRIYHRPKPIDPERHKAFCEWYDANYKDADGNPVCPPKHIPGSFKWKHR